MKTVTVTLVLKLNDDQPVQDWLPELVQEELVDGEELVSYRDNEPIKNWHNP